VDRDPEVVRQLTALLAELGCDRGTVQRADGLAWLAGPVRPVDVMFLDPPFDSGLLPGAIEAVAGRGWLVPGGLMYLEAPADLGPPPLPPGWTLHRSSRAGEVGYHLARRPGPAGSADPGAGEAPGSSAPGSPP
jgi:16S rRNA (guanine966-N2)-methyltransferase